ncbi:YbaB/EbfC family nucleoid-associated protein [Cardinium endosymbiont of Bemisia tabaci]|uniref:YbaB/EbfC family nucleoid-associated protein n=1 Tax=Candidatus Cardinium TaxID=273135 RepID=UPI000442D181|nr:YbaB/EbfC family nucleoid-associated protein [Cardinium endosymbiont of Bemisia tabaci]CDG49791.1 YbaB/EbfC DNA-binding family protein [Cardinium endosymbiont cBtQ1 of Bemisia tabaci]
MDIKNLFGAMNEVQAKMEGVKKQLDQLTVTKETGAGLVQVTVNGSKKVCAISIDEKLLNKTDRQMVQDLIIGAVNLALEEVDHKIQAVIQEHAAML